MEMTLEQLPSMVAMDTVAIGMASPGHLDNDLSNKRSGLKIAIVTVFLQTADTCSSSSSSA